MKRELLIPPLLGCLLLWPAGCSTPQAHIYFSAPRNAKISLTKPEQTQLAPVMLDLAQSDDAKNVELDEGGRPVKIVLDNGTKFKGFLYVYRTKLDQAEKLVEMDFQLTDERIKNLKDGQAVTVTGKSSKGKPIYKITLGLDR